MEALTAPWRQTSDCPTCPTCNEFTSNPRTLCPPGSDQCLRLLADVRQAARAMTNALLGGGGRSTIDHRFHFGCQGGGGQVLCILRYVPGKSRQLIDRDVLTSPGTRCDE